MSDLPRRDQPADIPQRSGHPHSLAGELSATAHRVEHAVEETLEHGIAAAEHTILRRFGRRALRAVRRTVKLAVWSLVVSYFAFGALLLVTRYALLPNIDAWRPEIEGMAKRALNATVSIGRIDAGWRAFNPHLALNDVRITGPRGGEPLALPRVDATVSWLSVLHLEPRFSTLRVLSPQLSATRLPDGATVVAGFALAPADGAAAGRSPALEWLLAQGRVIVRDAQVLYRDEQRAAAEELRLDDVNLLMVHSLGTHEFALQARPPASVAAPLDLRGRFRTSFRRASDMRRWTGEVFAQLDFADLASVSRFAPLPIPIERALGAVRGWVSFDRGEIVRSTADVALQDVVTRLAPDLQPLQLTSLQGRITQRRWSERFPSESSGQEFGLAHATFQTASGLVFPPLDLNVRLTPASAAAPRRTEVEASRIHLDSLAAVVAHLPLPRELRDWAGRHALRGTLSNLDVRWNGDEPGPADVTLRSRFSGLTSAAQPAPGDAGGALGLPGFANLSGAVRMERGAGTLEIAATDATLTFPGVFLEPLLTFAQLSGSVQWKRNGELVELRSDNLRASNADADVTASGTYRTAAFGPGVIDLTGRIARAEAPAAHRYIPRQVGAEALGWLEHALVRGRMTDGTVRLKGDLARFPFENPADGEFRFAGRVTDATLDVFPQVADGAIATTPGALWPVLSAIEADLLIDRAALKITAQRGRVYGARIEQAVARIDTLGDAPTLQVQGQASGPLSDMVRYVNESPVGRWIGGVTEGAEVQGPARLDLALTIPLAHAADSKVDGALALTGNTVTLAGIPSFTRATGTLHFNERGVRINNLATGLLGGQARLDASTRPDGALVFSASGVATPAGLRPLIPITAVQRLLDLSQGSTRYQATVTVNNETELRVDSDLVGLAIDGVAPLRKAAAESLPLRVERTSRTGSDHLRVQVAPMLAVQIERSRQDKGEWRLTRGVIALNEPANLPERGLLVLATMPTLDLEAWSGLLEPNPPQGRSNSAAASRADDSQIDLIALRAQELVLHGHHFRNVTLGATRAAEGGYNANVVSDGVVGYVAWRPGADAQSYGQVTARLSRLVIPASKEKEVVEVLRAPPRQIPALEISVEQFELADMKLGRLDLVAQNVGAAWRVRRLDIANPEMKLAATGAWAPTANGAARRMQLKFGLDTFDAGGALARLGFADALSKGTGRLEGEVEWSGSPLDIDYPSLSGRLALSLDNGRFLKVDTGNAARLLALLSLQSLGRTLAIDGGAQFAEGFAFTSIRGDAVIERGLLKTDTFRMKGASAAVLMSGTIDLRNETQQLLLVVLPEIDASTAALALGVANPVLGLGAFLAQFVLRDPLSKAFALQYDVTGTWADPQVVRRSRITPQPETVK